MRTSLRVATPVVGIAGASGLKFFACLWFAIGLGTVTLLPSAGGDREQVFAIAAIPAVAVPEAAPTARPATPATQPRRVDPRRASQQQLRSSHATPRPVVGMPTTVERPRTVRRPTRDVSKPVVAPAVSLETPEVPTTLPPVTTPELPVVGVVSVLPPALPVDVPALPAVPRVELP